MLLAAAVLAVGFLIGFVGSRKLRRPQHAAQAASVARTVSGSVGRRKTLTAPELQRACFSEMVRHVRVDRQGRTRAPARYLLQVNPVDLEVIDDTRSWFVDGLSDALVTAAKDNGWTLDGTPQVRFEADNARRAGVPSATPLDPVVAERAAPAAAPAGLALVRTDDASRTALAGTVSIGRSSDSTITIDDTRVSRAHATVEQTRAGWTITDTGSSNGTRVNGTAIAARSPKVLSAGDVIGIGPVDLRVEPAGGGGGTAVRGAGTRALDDSDRTRISREVLPPPRRPRP